VRGGKYPVVEPFYEKYDLPRLFNYSSLAGFEDITAPAKFNVRLPELLGEYTLATGAQHRASHPANCTETRIEYIQKSPGQSMVGAASDATPCLAAQFEYGRRKSP